MIEIQNVVFACPGNAEESYETLGVIRLKEFGNTRYVYGDPSGHPFCL